MGVRSGNLKGISMFLNDAHRAALSDHVHQALTKLKGAPAGAGERTFGEILKGIETVGTATTMAYMNAKHTKPGRQAVEVGGIPLDITAGVLGTVVAVSGYLGSYSEHAHNISNGFLCCYGVRMGMIWGADARAQQEVARATQQSQVGMLPAPNPASNVRPFTRQPQKYPWAA
jgi:hypothetical protein